MSIESRGGFGGRRGRLTAVISAALVALAALAPASPAAVDFGSDLGSPATSSNGCGHPSCTMWNANLHSSSTAGSLSSPMTGVIVSFTIKKSAGVWTPIHLRVISGPNGSFWQGRAASSDVTPASTAGIETFAVRVPIAQGDYVGMEQTGLPSSGSAFSRSASVFGASGVTASPALPGDGTPVIPPFFDNSEYLLQARVEPDADGDGFGDETQDGCPTSASAQGPCPDTEAPDTTITKGPKDRTRRKTATFEFIAGEPGSGFHRRLDGKGFAPRTSPYSVMVKKAVR